MSDYERMAEVIRYLDRNHQGQPGTEELAAVTGLSMSHFHRLFRRWAGIIPKDFLQCLTSEFAKHRLRESRSVLDAALDSGMSGPGRLQDLLVGLEAASPGEIKNRGRGLTLHWGFAESPFGSCSLAWNVRGICHLGFSGADGLGAKLALSKATAGVQNASKPCWPGRQGGPWRILSQRLSSRE